MEADKEKENEVKDEASSLKGDESLNENNDEIKKEEKENSKEDAKANDPALRKVQEVFTYESEHLQNIENKRLEFLSFYRKQNTFKWIVALVGVAVVVFAWIGIPNIATDSSGNQASWALPVAIVLVALVLVGIFTYTMVIKKIVNKKMKEYFAEFYYEMNQYIFDSDIYSEVNLLIPDRLERIQFDENKLYADVYEIGSRGLTEFKYKNNLMMICDCAAQVKQDKRIAPVFVGKYIVGPTSYQGEMPIHIYIKGDNKRALPPTNLDEVKAVHDDEDIIIFSNYDKWNKVLTTKVLKALRAIKVGKQLIDVAITLAAGKIYLCLGYDDPVMVLPLEHGFDPSPAKEVKHDLPIIFAFIGELFDGK